MMFFYEDVSSVNTEQRQRSIFPKMAGPNFTEKKAGALAYFIILGIFFGILAGLWFAFLGLSIESDVGVKMNQPEESDSVIFRIAKREFMKIHTLLNEKSHVSLDFPEEVPAPIF